jgi:hypothetical protein
MTDKQATDLAEFVEVTRQLNPLRTANARVAAADQMLKELIIAVEDDIERIFHQRMINRLRRRITRDKIGVGVGVMQRTSMLATNRLLARVDPARRRTSSTPSASSRRSRWPRRRAARSPSSARSTACRASRRPRSSASTPATPSR